MKSTMTTNDASYNVERTINSPYADARYAFGRVKVTYFEYVSAADALFSTAPYPVTCKYSAELVEPSALTDGEASWGMVRGSGDTATEATRNLLAQIDQLLRVMPAIIAETGN